MEKSHLIIFEKSMNNRFILIANKHNISYTALNFENVSSGNPLLDAINRIIDSRNIKERINNLIDYIIENEPKQIYLSNIEGFIGYSCSRILKKRFPGIKFIALQHGVFPLEFNLNKNKIIKLLNNLTFNTLGIGLFGEGFGGLIVDKYIVYGNAEKDFLISSRGWKQESIEENLNFLKSYMLTNKKFKKKEGYKGNAIFLLQNLSSSKLCSDKDEMKLINKTLIYLSRKYNVVYIKEHPFCLERINRIKIRENVVVVEDIIEGYMKSEIAYSFFSTALVDAKLFDLDTYAIFSKRIKVKKSVYKVFDDIINFENEIDT